jgi:predicted  nucleic acid-binding Zn-ribbon protein
MDKSFNKSQGSKQLKETNKSVQGMKMEIEAIKKSQIEGLPEMKSLGVSTESITANFINRIQKMEERISDIESTIEKLDSIER